MLELKTKANLAKEAHTLARGSELVHHRSVTYIPVDYETLKRDVVPDPDRTMWLPLSREELRLTATDMFNTLFSSDGELSSFSFMVMQNSAQNSLRVNGVLVRTESGLKRLLGNGDLIDPTGTFVPNTLVPMLNTEQGDKEEVLKVITEWLGDDKEEATSLLRHVATALAPGWSAVKYVLLLGEGRNGKSLLLKMIEAVFGTANVSNVTRQHMAEQSPVVTELNGKLVNIVYDGKAEYLKDSGIEKSLIAGEPVPIRRLYESTPTVVQTNALFMEGLNREPKSSDKSSALQKRLVRFQFPNVYALDHAFEKKMLSDEMLGAFLSLLIDNYVMENYVAELLAPTTKAVELQLEHMYVNSIALQFLKHLEDEDPVGALSLLGEPMEKLITQFQSWRIKENDLGSWSEPDVVALFHPLINSERKSARINNQPRKVRVITSFKSEAAQFIDTLKQTGEEDDVEALVAD